jgi:hypothetical protein
MRSTNMFLGVLGVERAVFLSLSRLASRLWWYGFARPRRSKVAAPCVAVGVPATIAGTECVAGARCTWERA